MAQNTTQHDIRTIDVNQHFISNVDNGVFIIDTELNILYYNKWIAIHAQVEENELIGNKLHEVFKTINVKTLKRKIKTALRIDSATYYTANTSHYLIPLKINQIQNSKFEYMQQDVSILPYGKEQNLVALIITDQTAMSNTNALLEESIQKTKALNKQLLKEQKTIKRQHEELIASSRNAAMGEMISMIAHQWRQPLSVINTSLATMKIKQELEILDKKTLFKAFAQIENTVLFLSETINDFRDYFRPHKIKTEFSLSELFDKSIYFLKAEISNQSIKYYEDIDKTITLKTYKNELLQSLINILKNSLDAFEETTTVDKQIHLSAKHQNDDIVIQIKDNAGGIDEEILSKVLEPYFSTKSKNGTGLGLYMCHTIITEHLAGKIHIQSPDNTTTITIILPIKESE